MLFGIRVKKKCLIVAISVVLLAIAACSVASSEPESRFYRIAVTKVYDGDTITANIDLGFDVALMKKSIRLYGFDAWEVSRIRRTVKITDEEIVRGKAARDDLKKLLDENKGRIYIRPEGTGKSVYGRLQASLWVFPVDSDPIDIAEWMRSRGHIRTPEQ